MGIKFKKEDTVLVIAGKAKGSQGKVLRVLREKDSILIEGVNRAKKHEKPNQKNEQGGIVDKEMPVHISNVMLVSPKSNKPIKVIRKAGDNGKRIRVEKKTGESID